jgi:hypothetical protein
LTATISSTPQRPAPAIGGGLLDGGKKTMSTTTTRRAILAGLAAAPVAGLPALAEVNSALAEAIERHRAAYAALSACDGPDDAVGELSDIEATAIDAVALTQCDEKGFIRKLEYLLERHKGIFGADFIFDESPSIMLALDLHFNLEESRS